MSAESATGSIPSQINAMTVDVEDYFQAEVFADLVSPDRWPELPSRVEQNTLRVIEFLEQRGARATFFILGWVADRHRDLVCRIRESGHEIGCHGQAHKPIYRTERETFRQDIRSAKATLEDIAGTAVVGYRAPTFSVTAETMWALDIIAEEGFVYDSSVFPIRHDRYGIPSANRFPHRIDLTAGGSLIEFPLSTVRLAGQNLPVAGGGYLRLFPVQLISRAIESINRHRHPAIVYFHPWELDPDQPRLGLRGLSRFRHYVNIDRMEQKLDRLLEVHRFAPAREVLDSVPGLVQSDT